MLEKLGYFPVLLLKKLLGILVEFTLTAYQEQNHHFVTTLQLEKQTHKAVKLPCQSATSVSATEWIKIQKS